MTSIDPNKIQFNTNTQGKKGQSSGETDDSAPQQETFVHDPQGTQKLLDALSAQADMNKLNVDPSVASIGKSISDFSRRADNNVAGMVQSVLANEFGFDMNNLSDGQLELVMNAFEKTLK